MAVFSDFCYKSDKLYIFATKTPLLRLILILNSFAPVRCPDVWGFTFFVTPGKWLYQVGPVIGLNRGINVTT